MGGKVCGPSAHAEEAENARGQLADPDPAVRSRAVRALGRLGAPLPYVPGLLADPDLGVRWCTLDVLEAQYAGAHADAVAVLLAGPLRGKAAEALGRFGARAHAGAVAELAADPEPEVRRESAAAIAMLGAEQHAGAVAGLLDDACADVRRQAVATLGLLGAVQHGAAVAARLRDPDPAVRWRAVECIERLGAGAWELHSTAVVGLLGDPVEGVRYRTVAALQRMGPAGLTALATAAREDGDVSVRVRAVEAMVPLHYHCALVQQFFVTRGKKKALGGEALPNTGEKRGVKGKRSKRTNRV